MKKLAIFICVLLSLGCSDAVLPAGQPQIVVEGWIEAGREPVVIVSTTVPVSSKWQEYEPVLESCVVRWATVSVFDGEKEVFLTGKPDAAYMPPYIYTTSRITGEVGRTYRLRVVYSGRTVEAETVIPAPAELEYAQPSMISDKAYEIKAGIQDDPQAKNYYKFFTKVKGLDTAYESSFLGLVDDADLADGVNEVKVLGKFTSSFGSSDNNTYFSPGDTVFVRFCTLTETGYQYWRDFEDVAALSLNPFFPVTKKIRSNIKGGLGYWTGYGSKYYTVCMPE